jgi:hypothetical protein
MTCSCILSCALAVRNLIVLFNLEFCDDSLVAVGFDVMIYPLYAVSWFCRNGVILFISVNTTFFYFLVISRLLASVLILSSARCNLSIRAGK